MQTNLSTNNTSSQPGGGATKVADNQGGLSDMFTKLLVAQIKNQDPLSPSDPSQYINQLAQISQTEALQKMSAITADNTSLMQSMQMLALGGQVGANVMVASDSVTLGKTPVRGMISMENLTSDATLVLTDAGGVKHNVSLGPLPVGDAPFVIDPVALGLPEGTYSLKVEAANGETPAVAIAGKLDSVKFSAGGALLKVENAGVVTPSSIVSFNGQSAALSN
ncbi:flagellar basal body rod modification protein [Herbaspirillum sp. HC18]|nr:flagellar basal body rod modification protein [Herbaspirillum sp. HC18]